MKIEKKTWPKEFQAILEGKKKFDLRLDDFACSPGDTLILKEYDPQTKSYTGREIEKKITYIAKLKDYQFWKKEDAEKYGLQIISLD